jgi:fumarylacetoacetate (FAA) hydrolase
MRLASLKHERDGRLVVVSADLEWCASAAAAAPTLQAALDDWVRCEPLLREIAQRLETGELPRDRFEQRLCASPLPRAYQWADGSAYLNHVELVRKARGAEMPAQFLIDPLMYQGGSDCLLGPRDPIPLENEDWGCDFEAEIAVILDDTPMGVTPEEARARIRLVTLVNDISLRNLIPNEIAKGFGFFHGKPPSAFAPVVATPDALAPAWDGGKLNLPLLSFVNDAPFGKPNAGQDMNFDFPALIAHAAKTRPLAAGAIIGSGTVSNRGPGGSPGAPISEGGLGYSCIAELRSVETISHGSPRTEFLRWGDRIAIEMLDASGASLFGRIEQAIERPV